METIFKIEIEVGLNPSTIEALKGIFSQKEAAGFDVPAQAATPGPAPAPAPAPTPEPQPVQDDEDLPADDEDLPADDAPDLPPTSKPTPTEDDARQAVKAARSRGVSAKVIKDLMRESFDIASSVECPVERRQELIDELNKLAA